MTNCNHQYTVLYLFINEDEEVRQIVSLQHKHETKSLFVGTTKSQKSEFFSSFLNQERETKRGSSAPPTNQFNCIVSRCHKGFVLGVWKKKDGIFRCFC
uniref:Uncharacterized protein n=1 Tax=Helianthus annuus TaxID=4232 RepID=A0A251SZF7_HELAN